MSERIRAFTLRRKTSKKGTIYYTAPFGDVDILAFADMESGNITAYYSSREPNPAIANPRQPQQASTDRPKIIPRPQPAVIREPSRQTPHHRPAPPIPSDHVDHTKVPDLYEGGDPGFDDADLIPF